LKWTSTVSGNAKGNVRMPERGMIRLIIIINIINKLKMLIDGMYSKNIRRKVS